MTKVTISKYSENAPRIQFIKDVNLAFATCDIDFILDCFADDVYWEMVGGKSWSGKDEIAESLKSMGDGEASELIIDTVLSQGNKCTANGVIKYPEGRGVAYCDVYTFTSDAPDAKIKTLLAYAIEIKT